MNAGVILSLAALTFAVLFVVVYPAPSVVERMMLPLLPYGVIHVASVRWPFAVPSLLVFLVGLTIDFATHGPLGYWALCYLVGLLVIRMAPEALLHRTLARVLLAVAALVSVGIVQFVVGSLYAMRLIDWQSVVWAVSATLALVAVLEAVLPYGVVRGRGFSVDAAALRRGE